ncbi:MAG: UbiA family prenyltransferase [Planctomycetota bacterium]
MTPWLRWFRVRLLGTALSNALVGYWLALERGHVWTEGTLLPLLVITTALYLFGMGHNDYCDRERDRTLYPDRPLPSGAIRAKTARGALISLLLVAATTLALAPFDPLAPGVVVAAILVAIVSYNAFCKDNKLLGPLAMGSARAGLVLLGAAVVNPHALLTVAVPAACLLGFVGLITSYSMLEERGSHWQRRLHHLVAAGWIIVAALAVVREVGPVPVAARILWTGTAAWCFLYAGRPIRRGKAPLTTLRLLLALLLLDAAILVSYDQAIAAWIPGIVFLVVWRPWFDKRSRSPKTSPITPSKPLGEAP